MLRHRFPNWLGEMVAVSRMSAGTLGMGIRRVEQCVRETGVRQGRAAFQFLLLFAGAVRDRPAALRRQRMVQGGLVRAVRGKRGVGAGRRRRRRRNGRRQWAAQRMRAQVRQEVRGRLDQVSWGERQAERWRVVEWGWWLVQRRAVRVGGSRRSAAGRGGTLWAAAASGAAALRRRGQAGECEGSAPAGLCRRQVRAAGAGRGHGPRYWRLGGGGKQGWVK